MILGVNCKFIKKINNEAIKKIKLYGIEKEKACIIMQIQNK